MPSHGLVTTNGLAANTELKDTEVVLAPKGHTDLGTMVAVLGLMEEEQAKQGSF